MRRRMILLLAVVLLTPMSSLWAADLVTTLIVLTKDNAQHQFALPDKPKVSFEGKNLIVVSDKTTTTFALSDVVRFTYKDLDPSGIQEVYIKDTNVSLEDGMLVVSQVKANSNVCVYSLDGRLVRQLAVKRAGTYRLNLSSLPFGVYLVKTGSLTYKITKR
jgi:hypothetical protein